MSENTSAQALIRQIAAHVKCTVCGRHFGTTDIQILGRREQVWAIRVKCRECRTQALLLAVVEGKATRPLYTDLSPDEWERFKDGPTISADDVISMHQYMQAYDGDLTDILEDPIPKEED